MVFSLIRKKSENKQKLIDCQEAFNIWTILKSKYVVTERLMTWEKYAHDLDLKLILKRHLAGIKKNISILETQIQNFHVKPPTYKNKAASTAPSNPEMVMDEYIAIDAFIYIQEHVENMLRSLRTSKTNDELRSSLQEMTISTIDQLNEVIHYLKLKGWLETPPLYHDLPPDLTEKLCTSEAYHLWDHLAYRYDNLRQTAIFSTFCFDTDFKAILAMGIEQLKKHSTIFEKELEYFGIPMPKKPSELLVPPDNTELLDDEYMYRQTLIGIEGTIIMHAQALKQCTFNDRIRGIFKKLLLEEIGLQDRLIKYGKLKGWLNPIPAYKS
ncbi:MAG: DUF3231 family protein [Bacillota bacterium]|nr:DUF3231 family protein [Bacillota bacterium]